VADQFSRSEYDALADLFLAADAPREPKPVTYPARATHGGPALRLADQVDAFASDAAPTQQAQPARREPLSVEALVLGHLPVLGAAWVTQYAKHVAEEGRTPVALLRLHEGQVWIDILTPRSVAARPQSRVGSNSDEPASLEAALRRAASECSHWLVRVDEIAEPDLVALPHLARVTLLTGADDAAVVASYRTIKNLSRSLDAARSDVGSGPSLKLAIMGADEAKATEAENKLRKAAATFLQNELEPAAKVAKIGGSSTIALFRGQATMDVAAMLATAHVGKVSSATMPGAESAAKHAVTETASESSAASVAHQGDAVHHVEQIEHASSTPPVVSQPATGDARVAAPIAAKATNALPIAGLQALGITCPVARDVTLAVASDNTLHMIAQAKPEAAQSLLASAAWALDHAQLLAMAKPGLLCEQPQLHVLANEMHEARGLLETAIAVHIVMQVGDVVVSKRVN
jgi:hypothetical protein